MIQRIQSVFLFLVVIISAVMMFAPFVNYQFVSLRLLPEFTHEAISPILMAPVIINIIVALFALFVLFKYKNRKQQLKLAKLLALLNMLLVVALLSIDFIDVEKFKSIIEKKYLWPSFLPVGSVILSYLAAHFIKKDEELVRSADRIR